MNKTTDTVGCAVRGTRSLASARPRPIRAAAPASTPSTPTAAAAERYRANLEKAC